MFPLPGTCKMIQRMHVYLAVLILTLGWVALPASAQQLSQEMRELFEEMLPQLDFDLQQKVRDAINLDRDYLELTPDEFKRFRDHPANPFEGWDNINPDSIQGVIRLQFETQPIRGRTAGQFERQSEEFLCECTAIVANANTGTVVVTDGKIQVALGTVVSDEGHVVTKLSEVEKCEQLFCKSRTGEKWSAEIVGRNRPNDVAILKIPDRVMRPVRFAERQPEIGGFIFSTNGGELPMAFGVYSNPPRSLIGKNQAFLGVKPVDDAVGVRVVEVTTGSSADEIGLQINDILTAVNGKPLGNVQTLVNEIRKNVPGDRIEIDFVREGQTMRETAILAGRNVGGPTADRFEQMKSFGAIQSQRRDEFPLVFQHDTPLVPEQCGGPVTDLDGNVIGVNIARGGRVASYAIPADHLQTLVREIMRPNVASKEKDID